MMKTGPLTKAELLRVWKGAVDPEYSRPLLEGTAPTGIELHTQQHAQLEAVSQAVDTGTQGLYVREYSGQTDLPASGAVKATVSLTLTRANDMQHVLALPAGMFFEEQAIDSSPTGPVTIPTGRRYYLKTTCSFAPGEATRVVNALGEKPGFGYNHAQALSITDVLQIGGGLINDSATVRATPERLFLDCANKPDALLPAHVGAWVLFTAGGNFTTAGPRRARVVSYSGPNLAVAPPRGGTLGLAEIYVIEVATGGIVGTFADGELIEQTVSGVTYSATLLRVVVNSNGKDYFAIQPLTRKDQGFDLTQTYKGRLTGATLNPTGGVFLEQPSIVVESGTATWKIMSWTDDYGVTSTNVAVPSGGRTAQLDEIGATRGLLRTSSEDDETYRQRLARVPDVVSPNAIRRVANRILKTVVDSITLREVGRTTLPMFYSDVDAADYAPEARNRADYWKRAMSFVEMRAFFLVEVPRMQDGDFGMFYDVGKYGFFDATGWPGFFDGYPWNAARRRMAIWQAVNQARAGGVGFELVERPDNIGDTEMAYSELPFYDGVTSEMGAVPRRVGSRQVKWSLFSATSFGLTRTVRFKVSLEVTAGVAHADLYNETDGEVVTGTPLTTSATGPTNVASVVLTLGAAAGNLKDDKMYSARVWLTGGGGGDAATISDARIEVTYE